jgi:hypothetical protein
VALGWVFLLAWVFVSLALSSKMQPSDLGGQDTNTTAQSMGRKQRCQHHQTGCPSVNVPEGETLLYPHRRRPVADGGWRDI